MSQATLANRLNVSPSAVGAYEQGRREPSFEILILLSKEFDVTTDYLLTGHGYTQQDLISLSEFLLSGFDEMIAMQLRLSPLLEELLAGIQMSNQIN